MPTRTVGPKARLSRRSTPKVRVKPRPSRAYVAPSITPSSSAWTKSPRSGSAGTAGLPPRDPQVRSADHLVRRHLGRGALEGDPTLLQEVRAMGDRQGHPRVLLDQEHAHPITVEARHDLEDLLHDHRREPERRL